MHGIIQLQFHLQHDRRWSFACKWLFIGQHYIKTSGRMSVVPACLAFERIDGHLWVIEEIASFAVKNREDFAQFMIFFRKNIGVLKIFTTILTNFLVCKFTKKTAQNNNSHKIYDWYFQATNVLTLWTLRTNCCSSIPPMLFINA